MQDQLRDNEGQRGNGEAGESIVSILFPVVFSLLPYTPCRAEFLKQGIEQDV